MLNSPRPWTTPITVYAVAPSEAGFIILQISMESSLLTILPNLSIGVVSILGLVYTTLRFVKALDERSDKHEKAMKEREEALREVESSVRNNLLQHLTAATIALQDNAKVLGRVVRHLDTSR